MHAVFQGEKAQTVRFAPPPTPIGISAWIRSALLSQGRLRGITHKTDKQLALSWPGNGRVGPVNIPTGRYSHCKGCVKSG